MTDRPIIFSAPMVRALLDGRKTQTRRIISTKGSANLFDGGWTDSYVMDPGNADWRARHVKFAPGDRLYVREAHGLVPASAYRMSDGVEQIVSPYADWTACIFREGFDRSQGGIRWRPSIYMPRWASRLTLIVTDVRVQRLQDITEADAIAEGCLMDPEPNDDGSHVPAEIAHERGGDIGWDSARDWFADLWNSLYGPDAWAANPWCVALTFTVHRRNIDNLENAA